MSRKAEPPAPDPDPPADQQIEMRVEVDDGIDAEANQRMLIDVLLGVIGVRHPAELPPRVGFALDMMRIAAAERVARICRADLADGGGGGAESDQAN